MRLALVLMLLLLGSYPGMVLAAPWTGPAGPYALQVQVQPAAPQVGEVRLAVRAESAGVPAERLQITAESDMPDMPGVPALHTELSAATAGQYTGTLRLPMAGDWRVRLRVRGPAGSGSAFMPLSVEALAPGLQLCAPPPGMTMGKLPPGPPPGLTVRTAAPPQVGSNLLLIEVNDSDGTPLDGIDVWTGLTMPGLYLHVPPGKAERTGPGRYQRELRLPMAGQWLLTLDVETAAGRTLDKSGQIATVRLARQTLNLTTRPASSGAQRFYLAAAAALVTGVFLLGLASRRHGASLLGAALCLVTALAVGEALRAHWPRSGAMGMQMDMAAPDLGMRGADVAAALPAMLETVRRGSVVDVLTLGATVAPLAAVPVDAGSAAWLVADGTPVKRGQPLLRRADGHTLAAPVAGLVSSTDSQLLGVDRVRVRARLPVRERERLQPGAPMQVVWKEAQPTVAARVDSIGDVVDSDTQTVSVEALVANPGLRLRPGQRVSLRLEVERRANVLAIPASAVVSEGEHRLAWVVHEVAGQRLVRRRYLLVGLMTADQVEVRGGLQEGDEIAVWGLERLQEGVAITPASRGGGPYRNLLLPKP